MKSGNLWFLLLIPALILAGRFHPHAQPALSSISAEGPGYRLVCQGEPFAIQVIRAERTLLAGTPGSAFVETTGGRHSLQRILSADRTDSGLDLKVGTSDSTVTVSIRFRLEPEIINVHWSIHSPQSPLAAGESFELAPSGHWYGGNVTSGHHWPLETGSIVLDPFLATSNQTTPFWLTSAGIGLFHDTYQPLGFRLNAAGDGRFSYRRIEQRDFSYQILVGGNIVDVHRTFIRLADKPRRIPLREYFTEPIFNTWIEYMTRVTQEDVITYARKIRQSGFPAHVLDLDDGWSIAYGDLEFDPVKFPDPRAMVDEVHRLGFRFALWVVPFIEPRAASFQVARERGFLVGDSSGDRPLLVKWWNGEAGLVDLSNPQAYDWFREGLFRLQREFGIDGFKLDAGDAEYLPAGSITFGKVTPNRYTDLFAGLGRFFDINELRVSWRVQELGLVQRLRDKNSNWSVESGLGSIVPHGLTESLIGYPYFCPDIIGGGLDADFLDPNFQGIDPELMVRWTQAAAFMPMMQFSYAPWRLPAEPASICRRYAELHRELGPYIWDLAQEAGRDGTPMVRPLFFRNPEDPATYTIPDQFLLGDRYLVAPVLSKGTTRRDVYLPVGTWKDFWSGERFSGGRWIRGYPAPLDRLPVFVSE
ncbi:MAG: glycoside hydrolase family 31 protein [Acidobacteriota bacterium]